MIIDFYGNGGGITPEEVDAKIQSALGDYTETDDFTTINGSGITDGGNLTVADPALVDTKINTALADYTQTSSFATINGSGITNGGNLVIEGGAGGGETVVELTQAEYDALTEYAEDTTYIITDASSINLDDYATTADTEAIANDVATLSGDVADKADKANVTARSTNWIPGWNNQGIITGGTQIYTGNINVNGNGKTVYTHTTGNLGTVYGPTAAGVQNQVLLSNGSGAPVWASYKFVFISQTDYDALTEKDSTTIYFITGE